MNPDNPYSSRAYFDSWELCFPIDATRLKTLMAESRVDPRGRVRICLHRDETDPLHEMIIALADHGYLRPHRQKGRQKSYVVLKGRLRIIFFSEAGEVIRRLDLDAAAQPVARFDASVWHTMTAMPGPDSPGSDPHNGALYLETILGPFDRDGTDWAPWAPGRSPRPEIDAYMAGTLRV